MKAWSYSSLKKFKTCPKQYAEVKIFKNFTEPPFTEATLYGTNFHEAAEHYVRDGTPLPEAFNYVKPHLDALRAIPGEKLCEKKMGLTKALEPCAFDDPEVWCRGVADLLIVNREKGVARVVDYKTGRSAKYADTAQLELMALMAGCCSLSPTTSSEPSTTSRRSATTGARGCRTSTGWSRR